MPAYRGGPSSSPSARMVAEVFSPLAFVALFLGSDHCRRAGLRRTDEQPLYADRRLPGVSRLIGAFTIHLVDPAKARGGNRYRAFGLNRELLAIQALFGPCWKGQFGNRRGAGPERICRRLRDVLVVSSRGWPRLSPRAGLARCGPSLGCPFGPDLQAQRLAANC